MKKSKELFLRQRLYENEKDEENEKRKYQLRLLENGKF